MLSIIVINYKTFEYTKRCIDSIIVHTKKTPYEIILIDNFSDDGSAEKLSKLFPTITHIHNKENQGFAKGNNTGIAASKGEYILLLNSDTELTEDSISYCLNNIKNNPKNIVSCKLIHPNNQIQHQCSKFPSISLNLIEFFRIHKTWKKNKVGKTLLSSYFNHMTYCEPDWIWGTFFMFKKSHLSRLTENKLNDDFFMYGEDMKWCYDFKNIGCKIVYLPNTEIIHFIGKSSNNSTLKNKSIVKNEIQFIKITNGNLYSIIYKLVRILNLLSTFRIDNFKFAFLYLRA